MNRTDIINVLIDKHNYTSYLEIGLGNGKNHQRIVCECKCGIDSKENDNDRPKFGQIFTICSREFFDINKKTYDLIFIDGDHNSEQVHLDLKNSLRCISPGGTIVMHDCHPKNKAMQEVPRIQSEWTGDVWKVFVGFRDVNWGYVVDTDYGCGIIKCDKPHAEFKISDLTFEEMTADKKEILGLVSTNEFLESLV